MTAWTTRRQGGDLVLEIDGRAIEITHPDKVLFPDAGLTKRDLAEYYARVADTLLPHAEGRAISMHRFPDGLGGKRFFQKRVPDYFPDWIETTRVERVEPVEEGEEDELTQVVIDSAATLVYLAQQASITPHIWLSRAQRPHHPDRLVVDLDPAGEAGFDEVRWAARTVRDLFRQAGLTPFAMTTGSRGIHVVAPLDGEASFDEVRPLARGLAEVLVERHPERLTLEHRKAERGDRIFLDILRNAYAQTTVAPYAVRARQGAPVATPIDWDELGRVEARTYRLDNLFRRLAQKEDPWKDIDGAAASLDGVRELLAGEGREG